MIFEKVQFGINSKIWVNGSKFHTNQQSRRVTSITPNKEVISDHEIMSWPNSRTTLGLSQAYIYLYRPIQPYIVEHVGKFQDTVVTINGCENIINSLTLFYTYNMLCREEWEVKQQRQRRQPTAMVFHLLHPGDSALCKAEKQSPDVSFAVLTNLFRYIASIDQKIP